MGALIDNALNARIDALILAGMDARVKFKKEMPLKAYADLLCEHKKIIQVVADELEISLLVSALVCLDEPKEADTTDEEQRMHCDFLRVALVELLEVQRVKAALPAGV